MARAHSWKRRAFFPGIPVGQIHVVKPRIVLKRIEPSADHMDAALESGATDMISGARERLQCRPHVCLRVIYFVPADARPFHRGFRCPADQVNTSVQDDGGGGTARARQRSNRPPAILSDLVGKRIVVGFRFCSIKPPRAYTRPASAATATWFAPRGSGAPENDRSEAGDRCGDRLGRHDLLRIHPPHASGRPMPCRRGLESPRLNSYLFLSFAVDLL